MDAIAVRSLTIYISHTLASSHALRQRQFVTARLFAAESVVPMFDFLFARVQQDRPALAHLSSKCDVLQPLLQSLQVPVTLFEPDVILTTVQQLLDGNAATMAKAFDIVERVARSASSPDINAALLKWNEAELATVRPAAVSGTSAVSDRNGPSDESTRRLVQFINRQHEFDYELHRRLDGGFSCGAFLLRRINVDTTTITAGSSSAPASQAFPQQAVLKWSTIMKKKQSSNLMALAPVLARAVEAGYPTPAWIAHGTSPSGFPYHVQAYVAGGTHVDTIYHQHRSMYSSSLRSATRGC